MTIQYTGFAANSKYKIQALFKDFQGPKLHFSSTKIINKKPYPTRGHLKFRLQILFPSTGDMLQNCQQMENFKICKI